MRSLVQVLKDISVDWGYRCFGKEHMENRVIRALRFAEEAIELAQACGVAEEKINDLTKAVYSKPSGDPFQEIGGVMVTLAVLTNSLGYDDIEFAFEAEVRRCISKDPEYFKERNQAKLDLGLDVGDFIEHS